LPKKPLKNQEAVEGISLPVLIPKKEVSDLLTILTLCPLNPTPSHSLAGLVFYVFSISTFLVISLWKRKHTYIFPLYLNTH
jgi:hypothetical protein